MDLLVSLVCTAMPAIDAASMTLEELAGRPETPAASSAAARAADAVQYRSGAGPCLEAIRSGDMVSVGLSDSRLRWPEFTDAAVTSGFQGLLALPLQVRDRTLGSLNLYSLSHGSFSPDEQAVARAFADQAAKVLSNAVEFAAAETRNEQLRQALATREVIGQAAGILMAREGCGAEEAFAIMRRASQQANRKLREVACDLVAAIEGRTTR